MAAKNHTHKYQHIPLGRGMLVWACARKAEGCTHHLPYNMENTIVGRLSICWDCESEFVLDENAILRSKPICPECRGLTSIESALAQIENKK